MRDQNRKSIGEKRRVILIGGAIVSIVLFTLLSVTLSGKKESKVSVAENTLILEKDLLAETAGTWDEIISKAIVKSGNRDLKSFYERRAYPGAPPVIPHEIEKDNKAIPGNCLNCHGEGEYSPKFKAYAPKTPHPTYTNCQQCHVPEGKSFFRPTNWEKPEGPKLGQKGLVSSPPVMPHELSLRENCAACHTGPSAVKEIRTTHPERVNCIQCHGIKKNPVFTPFERATP